MEVFETDVCIVGCGLTGILAAHRAIQNGLQTIVLERGGEYRPDDLNRDTWWHEETAIKEEGIDGWWTRYHNTFEKSEETFDDLVQIESAFHPWSFRYNMRYCVGGSARVWSGASWRLHPHDFKTQSLFGYGQDWPLSYSGLEPYYNQAEQLLEVSGPQNSKSANWPWVNNFPYPSFRRSFLDKRFEELLLGRFHFDTPPFAVRNKPADEGGCIGAKTCVQYCAAKAIFHPDERILSKILFDDNLYVMDRSAVTHLIASADGERIEAACGVGEDGPFLVKAKEFFLAANALENIRILLNSTNVTGVPIANTSGLLGQHFASHGAFTYTVTLSEPVFPNRGRPTTATSLDWLSGDFRTAQNGVVLEVWNNNFGLANSPWRQLYKLWKRNGHWGNTLVNKLRKYEHRFCINFIFEMEMEKNKAVKLSSAKDKFGIPLARVAVCPTQRDLLTADFIHKTVTEMRSLDGIESISFLGCGINGNHPMGGIRMSESKESGLLDTWCKSHDHKNLHILGAGAFCSTGTLNPTLTIAALTLRALDDPYLGWR